MAKKNVLHFTSMLVILFTKCGAQFEEMSLTSVERPTNLPTHYDCGSVYYRPKYFFELEDGTKEHPYIFNVTMKELQEQGSRIISVNTMLNDAVQNFTYFDGVSEVTLGVVGYSGMSSTSFPVEIYQRAYSMALFGAKQNGENVWLCDGVLINQQWILSSASCFNNNFNSLLSTPEFVRLGDLDYNEIEKHEIPIYQEAINYEIEQTIIHPEYVPFQNNHNLALIKISRPIPFYSRKIYPICLPWADAKLKTPLEPSLTGWGVISKNGNASLLKSIEIDTFDAEMCDQEFSLLEGYIEKHTGAAPRGRIVLCAGFADKVNDVSCMGHSGSAITYESNSKLNLYGITSSGTGCGWNYPHGSFIPINTKYLTWIKEVAFSP